MSYDRIKGYHYYEELGIEIAEGQHAGGTRRTRQEDTLAFRPWYAPTFVIGAEEKGEHQIVIAQMMCADGLGGHHREEKRGIMGLGYVPMATGADASAIARQVFLNNPPTSAAELEETAQLAHEAIYTRLNTSRRLQEREKVGTTFTELFLSRRYDIKKNYPLGYRAHVLAIGNTAVIAIYPDGSYQQLTTDEVEPYEIVDEEAGKIYKGETTRSLGRNQNMPLIRDKNFFAHDLERGSTLLVCSDGITHYQKLPEIRDKIYGVSLDKARRELIQGSLGKAPETADNISLVLVRFH